MSLENAGEEPGRNGSCLRSPAPPAAKPSYFLWLVAGTGMEAAWSYWKSIPRVRLGEAQASTSLRGGGRQNEWPVRVTGSAVDCFLREFFPLKTPNRGSFGHLQSSFSRRRSFTRLLNSQREPVPDFIRGSLCLFPPSALTPEWPWAGSGERRHQAPHAHLCYRFPLRLDPEDRRAFTSN